MAPRTTYANLPQGYSPFTLFDQSFSDVGLLGNIPCTCVTAANVITLTPVLAVNPPTPAASAYPPTIAGYQNYLKFAFVADATSSGVVSAVIAGPAGTTNTTLPVYKGAGVQVTTGDVVAGTYYELAFSAALNSGNGGFYLLSPLFGAAVLAPIANNTVLGNNSGISAAPSAISASAVLDMVGNTQGNLLFRGAATWGVVAPLTSHGILLGQNTAAPTATAVMTNGQLLIGQTAADPAPTTISGDITISAAGVTAIGANKVTSAMIRQGVARSVIGVTGNATANVADIQGTANQALVVNSAGTALAFGQVNLAAAAAVTGTLPSTLGGTDNAVYAIGDLLQASATTTLARLAAVATGNVLLSGGVATVSAWGKVGLTTHVSGQLPLANGGTAANLVASNGGIFYSTGSAGAILSGTATASLPLLSGATAAPTWATIGYPTSATSGGVPFFSSTTVMGSSAILNLNQLLIGGGAGNPPTTLGTTGTATTVLHGSATAPTFGQIVAADVTTNTLTNATLAQAAANTFKGNPTTGTANVTDFTMGSLTTKATPVAADTLIIADSAASFALKVATVGTVASAGSVSSIAGNTGAFTLSNGITNSGNDIRLNVGQLPGVSTNSSASAGNLGEYIESVIVTGSAVSPGTGSAANVTSISLTAGDWDVRAIGNYKGGATTTVAFAFLSISTTTGVLDTTPGRYFGAPVSGTASTLFAGGGGNEFAISIPPYRFSLAGTTTIFLVTQQSYATSTMSTYGILSARRIR